LNSDAGREARLVIERQTSHMTRMIEDLLDLSRVIAGKTHLKLERFDLAALVTGVIAAWQAEGRTASHVVTVDARPVWVHADRTRMEQVLANLLDNALKFTARGHRVHVTAAPSGDAAALDVEDDGQGVAPECSAACSIPSCKAING
jgi:two-component system, sensor histidine kinase